MTHRNAAYAIVLAAVAFQLTACGQEEEVARITQETIAFRSGDLQMSGSLYLPEAEEPVPLLVLFHAASGGSSEYPFYGHLKKELPEAGIATFVYDRRGTGNQPGNFTTASFEYLAADGIAAATVLAKHPSIDPHRIGAWGISQGGWVAPLAAAMSDEISFAIAVSGPGVTPARQMAFAAEYHLREAGYDEETVELAMSLRARVDAYYRNPDAAELVALQETIDAHADAPWFPLAFLPRRGELPADVTQSKWHQEMDFEPTEFLSTMRDPLLIIYGEQDRWVPVQESVDAIREALPDESSLAIYRSQSSGHLMSGQAEGMDYDGSLPVEDTYLVVMIDWIASLRSQ